MPVKISDILSQSAFSKGSSGYAIKKAVAFGFWKDICGRRFADFSMPYDIKGSTLFVAVKNPQVMQELIFNKTALLEKLRGYYTPLNIKIEEIRYDYKVWASLTSSVYLAGDESLEMLEDKEIDEVPLSDAENRSISSVMKSINSLSFLSNEIKNKCSKNIINSFKAKKIRNRG